MPIVNCNKLKEEEGKLVVVVVTFSVNKGVVGGRRVA